MTTEPSCWHRQVPGFGEASIRPVRPLADLDVIYDWVTRDRSRFWGMREATRDEVREIYEYLDSLTTHHAYLLLRNGRPVALFQTYEPGADPVGERYDVRPGDFGMHLLIGPPDSGTAPGFTGVVLSTILAFILAEPSRRRIVAEPDIHNDPAIAQLLRAGFVPGPCIDLPEKRARLFFLDRATLTGGPTPDPAAVDRGAPGRGDPDPAAPGGAVASPVSSECTG